MFPNVDAAQVVMAVVITLAMVLVPILLDRCGQ